ncbi:DUF6084 family protein [Rhodococcus rhodochrous]|uniref:Uncharacterized protein n=1 Tax=Rhodococcus rhodochrous KG-21 TaxID=1441923 RepID=A0A0N0S0Q4_RHORH|nr:DUF6084 family protein [Rhodococcus rhodochrous]KOS55477.1 hypothetical protein Z051_14395 [Rhodococcus rhodochrous KG-21]
MTALDFTVVDIAPEPYAATPSLSARLRIRETTGAPVHSVALRCQVRLEPARRRYGPDAEAALGDLFGTRDRWGSTLSSFAWLQTSTMVPGFVGECETALPLPCTYDFEVAAARYLHALGDGAVPLLLLFSGTVFGRGDGGVAVEPVPWDREARYDLPVAVWHEMIRSHFPGTGFARMGHDTLAALTRYKVAHGHTDLDAAVTELLVAAEARPAATTGAGEAAS